MVDLDSSTMNSVIKDETNFSVFKDEVDENSQQNGDDVSENSPPPPTQGESTRRLLAKRYPPLPHPAAGRC